MWLAVLVGLAHRRVIVAIRFLFLLFLFVVLFLLLVVLFIFYDFTGVVEDGSGDDPLTNVVADFKVGR